MQPKIFHLKTPHLFIWSETIGILWCIPVSLDITFLGIHNGQSPHWCIYNFVHMAHQPKYLQSCTLDLCIHIFLKREKNSSFWIGHNSVKWRLTSHIKGKHDIETTYGEYFVSFAVFKIQFLISLHYFWCYLRKEYIWVSFVFVLSLSLFCFLLQDVENSKDLRKTGLYAQSSRSHGEVNEIRRLNRTSCLLQCWIIWNASLPWLVNIKRKQSDELWQSAGIYDFPWDTVPQKNSSGEGVINTYLDSGLGYN